ncbi:NADH-quinone oxidoreductase subunit C [candidate division KSB1 bacterium]|nr:NADH-quinone oxidoreductase subunit C [candidate division KSB1 bacterium]
MTTQWLLKNDLQAFFDKFPNATYEEQFEQPNVWIPSEELSDVFEFIKNNKDYPMEMLVDITAVDYLSSDYAEKPNHTGREEDLLSETRFDLVYHFYSFSKNKRVRIITSCGGEHPEVVSSYKWWKSAHFQEREVWDLFGIKFKDHPDLRRILLYKEFEGFPLRKDYPVMGEQPRLEFRTLENDNG